MRSISCLVSKVTLCLLAYTDTVRALTEYVPPGYGYQAAQAPGTYWDLYANWQLAFFSVPDAAEFFVSGKEKQMLEWFFFHGSYSGPTSFSEDVVDRYASSISKPGFLRAMLGPYDNRAVGAASAFFKGTIGQSPLQMPTLAIGGEASLGLFVGALWGDIISNLETDITPKAGHWIADENPACVASRIQQFLDQEQHLPPPVGSLISDRQGDFDCGIFWDVGERCPGRWVMD